MKKFILTFVTATLLFTSCEETPVVPPHGESKAVNHAKNYPADVAVKWINLQQRLIKTTQGFDPPVTMRSFAYSGLTMYESIVRGMPGYKSIASPLIGADINALQKPQLIYWAASANAAMAFILKNLFATTSLANMSAIDSLESAFHSEFQDQIPNWILSQSSDYGRKIADRIFEWSKTDGGHEGYLKGTSDTYDPPTGDGLWIPTPPALAKPSRPYWGDNRSFVPNSALTTLPSPPIAYSEDPESDFYKMANEIYTISLSLSEEEIRIVRFWADLPGQFATGGHYTNIATQLIDENDLNLDQAAIIYAKHGIALNEAAICVFKAKYTYNLLRPISYIRNVLGYGSWNTLISTPAHPEYPAQHPAIGRASSVVLESFFGENYSFVDRTQESLYGARSYEKLEDYAIEAAKSRVLGGIHYVRSAEIGLQQGKKVGDLVNGIKFR
jgi:hypothetical protein